MRYAWVFTLVAGCGQFRAGPAPPLPDPPATHTAQQRVVKPGPPRALACIQHPRIDVWESRLRSHDGLRAATRETLVRARPFLPRVRRIFTKAGLPPSLALLPVIESEFYRQAQGRLDDRGLWQLRVATAQRFGLVVNERRDQRLHPYRATRAAARYLRALHRHYHDWPLALAAYNAGENRVDRALARRPRASFWELAESGQLPRTTSDYVPRFLALVRITDGTGACGTSPAAPAPVVASAKPVAVARPVARTRDAAAFGCGVTPRGVEVPPPSRSGLDL